MDSRKFWNFDGSVDLRAYFKEVDSIPLLTDVEERELATLIAGGDADARSQMVEANLRLVIRIALEYTGRGMRFDDLISEGNIGLIHAAERYDLSYGTRFCTYSSFWIRQAIGNALTNTAAMVRLPAHTIGLMTRWRRAERRLFRESGENPSFDQVADHMGLSKGHRKIVCHAKCSMDLRLENGGEGESGSWTPTELADPHGNPLVKMEREEELQILRERLERLSEREREVITLRFGLGGEAPLIFKEIGKRLSVSRQRARTISEKSLRKLSMRFWTNGSQE